MKVTRLLPYALTASVAGVATYMVFNKKIGKKMINAMGSTMEDAGKALKK